MDVMETVERHRLFGVVRTATAEQAIRCGLAAIEGGVRLIELTLTIPEWEGAFAGLRGHPGVVLGAGTVMHPEQAEAALAAGPRSSCRRMRNPPWSPSASTARCSYPWAG